MPSQKRKRAPGGGRKPAGYKGERVADYPAQIFRLPIATLAPLRALSKIRGIALWRLVDEAAWILLKQVRGTEAGEVNAAAKLETAKLRAKTTKSARK